MLETDATYTGWANVIINANCGVMLVFAPFIIFLILTQSPESLGMLRWLVLSDTILNLIYSTSLYFLKPAVYTGKPVQITFYGIAQNLAETSNETYKFYEFISLVPMMTSFLFFIQMVYRCRQMLPPTNNYWLNENRFCRRIGFFVFLLTIVPNAIFLRLSRVDLDSWNEFSDHSYFKTEKEALLPSNVIFYDFKFSTFFYFYITSTLGSFGLSILIFIKLQYFLIKALRESRKYYQEGTFRQQRVVYIGFTYQMLCYFLLFGIPLTFIIIFGLTNIIKINTLYRSMRVLTSFYPIIEGCNVIWFIRYYREFTLRLFGNILKPFTFFSRCRSENEPEREEAIMYNLSAPI